MKLWQKPKKPLCQTSNPCCIPKQKLSLFGSPCLCLGGTCRLSLGLSKQPVSLLFCSQTRMTLLTPSSHCHTKPFLAVIHLLVTEGPNKLLEGTPMTSECPVLCNLGFYGSAPLYPREMLQLCTASPECSNTTLTRASFPSQSITLGTDISIILELQPA